jgi:putative heme-binding domain-containing protein
MKPLSFIALSAFLLFAPTRAADGLRLPAGFEATEFADAKLANDIYCLTTDPKGRVIVSGRGYIRMLLDDDSDGKADRALDFAGPPADGAMGLTWDDDALLAIGGGGMWRWRHADGPGRELRPELLFKCKTGGEHDSHAIRRGPDGWLYLLCGNSANVPKSLIGDHAPLPTSPVKKPIAGCVVRFPPDFKGSEIVASGLRNAYGMDFNADGELFTYDSDNERCVSLPWYEGTRLYHVVDGANFGWRSPQLCDSWRLPATAADVNAPLVDLGRGSPTGVVCYRHTQFPEHYRGGLFLLDWTFGRIWFVRLTRDGSSYKATPEVFLQTTGDNGFAPTAAAVHPITGDLFVSIGGRGTRGAVYRIRYQAGLKGARPEKPARPDRIHSHEWWDGRDHELLDAATSVNGLARRHALEEIRRHRAKFSKEDIKKRIIESAASPDRSERQAAARILTDLPAAEHTDMNRFLGNASQLLTRHLAEPDAGIVALTGNPDVVEAVRVEAVRELQIMIGDITDPRLKGTVWEGYSRHSPVEVSEDVKKRIRDLFPTRLAALDRELSRTLAMMEDEWPAMLTKISEKWNVKSSAIDDIHYLIVLARLKGPRPAEVTHATAHALLRLDAKFNAIGAARDSNWPLRIAELHAGLAARDPALNAALLADAEFGRPDHALFAHAPGFDRAVAAERFLVRAEKGNFAWNADLIDLIGALPAEKARPVLRKLWGEAGLDEAIVAVLAKHAGVEDRKRLMSGLVSPRVATVASCLGALEKLAAPTGEELREETVSLVQALRQTPTGKEAEPLRAALVARLRTLTKQKWERAEDWTNWAVKEYPTFAARLADPDGVDVATWERRLAKVEWLSGDVEKGRSLFTKMSCSSCHSGTQALGPDLVGVTGRFSRADLFTAILRPSKDVSPRYRTTLVTTVDGKLYQGLIVYDAVDSLILQSGPGTTVRLDGRQVAERQPTARSLMPAGLLDRASERDIADLYAYLRSLGAKKP